MDSSSHLTSVVGSRRLDRFQQQPAHILLGSRLDYQDGLVGRRWGNQPEGAAGLDEREISL